MTESVHPVVLYGGTGSRLWALSRKALPTKSAAILGGRRLLQFALERLSTSKTLVAWVAEEAHRFLAQKAIQAASMQGTQLLAPAPRNTMAAKAIAVSINKPDQLVLFAPADHYIQDAAAFASTVESGVTTAREWNIVTFGVTSSFPSTVYRYIKQDAALSEQSDDPARRLKAFVEKPCATNAAALVLAGDHLWNAGLLLAEAKVLLAALKAHAPDILAACRRAASDGARDGDFLRVERSAFENCRSPSIDCTVLEHSSRVAVAPLKRMWRDVESWNAMAPLHTEDAHNNRINGRGFSIGARDTFIRAPTRPVITLGIDNLLIIDSRDSLIVAHSGCAEQVKEVVSLLITNGRSEAAKHRCVPRPGGTYDTTIDGGDRFSVKRLSVKPSGRLAMRKHRHRAVHWVVVKGTARVLQEGRESLVHDNHLVYMPSGAKYQLDTIRARRYFKLLKCRRAVIWVTTTSSASTKTSHSSFPI